MSRKGLGSTHIRVEMYFCLSYFFRTQNTLFVLRNKWKSPKQEWGATPFYVFPQEEKNPSPLDKIPEIQQYIFRVVDDYRENLSYSNFTLARISTSSNCLQYFQKLFRQVRYELYAHLWPFIPGLVYDITGLVGYLLPSL